MTPTARHRTHDKKYTNNYYPLTANVDPFLWRKSLHTFYIMPTMKKTEIIQVIFSLIVYQTTYQVPRVSVHISGNLCVCCKPQICCLTLRTASDILQRWRWIAPFRGKGAHQMGVCAGFAWCNPDLNGRTCAVLVCYFTYWWARRGSSPNAEPSLYSVYSKWAESQEKNKTRTPNPGVVVPLPVPLHCIPFHW